MASISALVDFGADSPSPSPPRTAASEQSITATAPPPGRPAKLSECLGRFLIFNEKFNSGIIQLDGGGSAAGYIFCFYHLRNVRLRRGEGQQQPQKGDQVRCDAWLMDPGQRVAYLAAQVWQEGAELGPTEINRIRAAPTAEEAEFYANCCADLPGLLPGGGGVNGVEKAKERSRSRGADSSRQNRRERSEERSRNRNSHRHARSRSGDRRQG